MGLNKSVSRNKLAELKARYGRGRWFTFTDTRSPLLRVSLSLQIVSQLPSAGSDAVLYATANGNPVKGTNVLQKSHCCPACFLLTDIHL